MFVVSFGNAAPEMSPPTAVGDNESRVLSIARQRGRVQTDDIAKALNIPKRSALRLLRSLVEVKVLRRVGERGRNVYYTAYFDVSDDTS